ncbi:hypothetical protein DFR43_11465 [Tepidicella xavieri]|uniref:Uncharacterized protein n=1 Tax=Tepidicella xavieri TaxID=360241 RepID=A0A4R6U3K7_9BURK|nr:hypothetical protein DFR43_11465 [Tepidicella xavieri]
MPAARAHLRWRQRSSLPGLSFTVAAWIVLVAINVEHWADIYVLFNGVRKNLAFLVWRFFCLSYFPASHLSAWKNKKWSLFLLWLLEHQFTRHPYRNDTGYDRPSVLVHRFAVVFLVRMRKRLYVTLYNLLYAPFPTHRTPFHEHHGSTPSRHDRHESKKSGCVAFRLFESDKIKGLRFRFVFCKKTCASGNRNGKPGANAFRFEEKNDGKVIACGQQIDRFMGD